MSKIKSLIKIELFKKTKQHLTGTLFVPRMGFEIRRVQRCFCWEVHVYGNPLGTNISPSSRHT